MEAFVVKILPSLLIIVVMTSCVVTEKLSLGEKNGTKGRTQGNMNNTKNECSQDGTGIRRNIVQYTFTADRQCYTDNFVGGRPPEGLRNDNDALRYICQPPKPNQGITYYATMFDERYGIAVFSAYRLSPLTVSFPRQDVNPDFCPTPGIEGQGNRIMYAKQPYKKYKKKKLYQRGHLVPAKTFSGGLLEQYLSTFVYTNTVPQHTAFNGGKWRTFEEKIRKYHSNRCARAGGFLYLLTGTAFVSVQPGNPDPQVNHPARKRLGVGNRGIYIPNSLWTAGCCVPLFNPNNKASFAVIGNNEQNPNLMQITLTQLQNILLRDIGPLGLNIGGPAVELFPNSACANNDLPNPLPVTAIGG